MSRVQRYVLGWYDSEARTIYTRWIFKASCVKDIINYILENFSDSDFTYIFNCNVGGLLNSLNGYEISDVSELRQKAKEIYGNNPGKFKRDLRTSRGPYIWFLVKDSELFNILDRDDKDDNGYSKASFIDLTKSAPKLYVFAYLDDTGQFQPEYTFKSENLSDAVDKVLSLFPDRKFHHAFAEKMSMESIKPFADLDGCKIREKAKEIYGADPEKFKRELRDNNRWLGTSAEIESAIMKEYGKLILHDV